MLFIDLDQTLVDTQRDAQGRILHLEVRPGHEEFFASLQDVPKALFTWADLAYAREILARMGWDRHFLRVFSADNPPGPAQGPFVLLDDQPFDSPLLQAKLTLLGDCRPERHIEARPGRPLARFIPEIRTRLGSSPRINPAEPAYGKVRPRVSVYPPNAKVDRVVQVYQRLEDDLIAWGLRPERMMFMWGKNVEFPAARSFAYTMRPGKMVIVTAAPKLENQGQGRIEGVMRHEMAHALQFVWPREQLDAIILNRGLQPPSGVETHADLLAEALWGDPILYDKETVQDIERGTTRRPLHLPNAPFPTGILKNPRCC